MCASSRVAHVAARIPEISGCDFFGKCLTEAQSADLFLFLGKCTLELEGWNSPKSLDSIMQVTRGRTRRKGGSSPIAFADCFAYARAYAFRSLGQEVANGRELKKAEHQPFLLGEINTRSEP